MISCLLLECRKACKRFRMRSLWEWRHCFLFQAPLQCEVWRNGWLTPRPWSQTWTLSGTLCQLCNYFCCFFFFRDVTAYGTYDSCVSNLCDELCRMKIIYKMFSLNIMVKSSGSILAGPKPVPKYSVVQSILRKKAFIIFLPYFKF